MADSGFEKITRADLPKLRQELKVKQLGVCPICGKDLTKVSASNLVIDHDHTTGIVRAVLHKGCNGLEGKVKRLLTSWGKAKGLDQCIATLERLIAFWKLHRTPQTNYIYYNHKTAAEKRAAYNKKRRKQYHAKK